MHPHKEDARSRVFHGVARNCTIRYGAFVKLLSLPFWTCDIKPYINLIVSKLEHQDSGP